MSRDLELMRLHDGELSGEELAELEASLDAHDQAVLDGLDQLGDVVRALDGRAADPSLSDAIMARLDQPEPPAAAVVKLEPRAAARRTTPVVVVGIALAAAAAALFWFKASDSPKHSASPLALSEKPAPVAPAPAPAPPVEPKTEAPVDEDVNPAVAIEAVDFGNQGGTIFMVPAGDEATPVVWLVDEPASAKVEPL